MGQDASTSCPACGVAVAPGYPRCPKCHAALPSAPLHLPAPARARQAGGTSAASDSPLPWIVGAVAVLTQDRHAPEETAYLPRKRHGMPVLSIKRIADA